MQDCVFCAIVAGKIPAQKEYEDEQVVAFRDINPQAPVHVLVIPKKHIENFEQLNGDHDAVLGGLQRVIGKLVDQLQIQAGYKVLINGGKYQEVKHMHYHLLGGGDLH